MLGGTLALLLLGPPALPSEASASVPPPPPPEPVRTASLTRSRDIVDPFSSRPFPRSARSVDLRDPFDRVPSPGDAAGQEAGRRAAPEAHVPSGSADLVDPFRDPRLGCGTTTTNDTTTRNGVPIQRPRAQAPAPRPCAPSDAPLRDPFARPR